MTSNESSSLLPRDNKEERSTSKFRLRLGYACGHAQNDLCASMYFSYLLVYLEGTGLSPVHAGIVLIAGQLVDGMATPVVGALSDQVDCTNSKFIGGKCFGLSGRRKAWYIGGITLVTFTFWALFTPIEDDDTVGGGTAAILFSPVVHYAIANCLFQIGWASVQVSHMAMVPELTPLVSERCFLNSIRFAVTVGSSITVYVLVWAFTAVTSTSTENNTTMLLKILQSISYIVLFVGLLLAIVFVFLVKEKQSPSEASRRRPTVRESIKWSELESSILRSSIIKHVEAETQESMTPKRSSIVRASITRSSFVEPETIDDMAETPPQEKGTRNDTSQQWEVVTCTTVREWFGKPGFYGVAANYTCTRLCVNSMQLYIPFFVLYNLPSFPSAVATVPMAAYVGMCLSSVLAPHMNSHITDAARLYALASLIFILPGTILLFVFGGESLSVVFVAATLLGIGGAQLMVTTQTQVCELVGNDLNGGIVFGMMSFCDKVSTGLVIYAIQRLAERIHEANSDVVLGSLYRIASAGVPFLCSLIGALALLCVPKSIRDSRHGCCNTIVDELHVVEELEC